MSLDAKKVLVTGGASFIGSHLVDALLARGARVRVVDNLVAGRIADIQAHVDAGRVEFVQADLCDDGVARHALRSTDICFHLAARHGGRGFVDRYQANCATNFLLDGAVFRAALDEGVKVVYASSACAYPLYLQRDVERDVRLAEPLVGPPYEPDNVYGWAKVVGELTLQAFHREHGLPAASGRFFTVFGPRAYETHAVTAMIARAFIRQDPFVVWGTGEQVRNWTHVSDIVRGVLLLAEHVDDASAYNFGTTESVRVIDAVREVIRYARERYDAGYDPKIELRPSAPTGPVHRVADHRRATERLGWHPQVHFYDGLREMIDYYFATKDREAVRAIMAREG